MNSINKYILFTLLLFFTIFSYGQTTIWQEDFSTYSDGATTAGDNLPDPPGPPSADGLTDWTISYAGSGNFSIQSNELEASGMDAIGTWISQKIDISSYNFTKVSLDISWIGGVLFDNEDTILVYYKIDGGSETLFYENYLTEVVDVGSGTFTTSILSGDTVEIVIKTINDGGGVFYNRFDNISVNEVVEIFSYNGGGNWNNGNSWSYDDFSAPTRTAAGAAPANDQIAIIRNNDIITFNISDEIAGLEIRNTGTLQWSGTNDLDINQGLVDIESGGNMDRNSNTATLRFISGIVSNLNNEGSVSLSNIDFTVDGVILNITGTSSITLVGDFDFQQDFIEVTNSLSSGTITANRLFFDNDDCSFTNNGTVVINDAIEIIHQIMMIIIQ